MSGLSGLSVPFSGGHSTMHLMTPGFIVGTFASVPVDTVHNLCTCTTCLVVANLHRISIVCVSSSVKAVSTFLLIVAGFSDKVLCV